MSRVVLMGSGETAPTMVRVHRRVFADVGPGPAVLLDTPFGFQANADDLVEKTRTYFAESVGREVEVASWRRRDAPTVEQERALALLHSARWAFAGPGSPSYALRQWVGTPVPGALADVVGRGGTVCLGSAAAVLAGARAIPVYEIYKAGEDPHWLEGVDLLGSLAGLPAAVVPHYDNNEGGHYDTRYCYLGEERLTVLEAALPEATGILGVDEHTAVLLDLVAGTAEVVGSGGMTLRSGGVSQRFTDGTVLPLTEVATILRGEGSRVGLGRHALPAGACRPSTATVVPPPWRRCARWQTMPASRSTQRSTTGPSTVRSPRCSISNSPFRTGRPTPSKATTRTPAGCCARWSCTSATWRWSAPVTLAPWSSRTSTSCSPSG